MVSVLQSLLNLSDRQPPRRCAAASKTKPRCPAESLHGDGTEIRRQHGTQSRHSQQGRQLVRRFAVGPFAKECFPHPLRCPLAGRVVCLLLVGQRKERRGPGEFGGEGALEHPGQTRVDAYLLRMSALTVQEFARGHPCQPAAVQRLAQFGGHLTWEYPGERPSGTVKSGSSLETRECYDLPGPVAGPTGRWDPQPWSP
jgi:hypothetical protein